MELLTPLYYNFVITADESPALQGGDGGSFKDRRFYG
jgi:hypothetical protein